MTIETTTEKQIKTADLALAGFLYLFFPLERIDKRKGDKKAYFVFEKTEQVETLIEDFWKGQARVDPAVYFQALRSVKARLYGE